MCEKNLVLGLISKSRMYKPRMFELLICVIDFQIGIYFTLKCTVLKHEPVEVVYQVTVKEKRREENRTGRLVQNKCYACHVCYVSVFFSLSYPCRHLCCRGVSPSTHTLQNASERRGDQRETCVSHSN